MIYLKKRNSDNDSVRLVDSLKMKLDWIEFSYLVKEFGERWYLIYSLKYVIQIPLVN